MWDDTKLELIMEVKNAHEGQRIQCGAVGPDGFLYTGGDDKVSVLSAFMQYVMQSVHVGMVSVSCDSCTMFGLTVRCMPGRSTHPCEHLCGFHCFLTSFAH